MTNILSLALGLVLYDYLDQSQLGIELLLEFLSESHNFILCMPNYV